MAERTIEDYLREEYFRLLPSISLVLEQLETEIRHALLPISLDLSSHERVVVTSRIKECESAVDALRRRQEGGIFDREQIELYTLSSLNDLAGVRVMVFPRSRISSVDEILRPRFSSWTADPIPGFRDEDPPMALKYYGYVGTSTTIRGEYQVAPLSTGLFWEIEHSVIYKPAPDLKGIADNLEMKQRTQEVLDALQRFEETFERLMRLESEDIQF